MTPLAPAQWHARFTHQALWTQALRRHLFHQLGLTNAKMILEVGCGTGAILSTIETSGTIHGLDINPTYLALARQNTPSALLTTGDGLRLPYANETFNSTLCHFLLLWVRNPQTVLQEMARVTRRGGWVLALAEPDYGGRIDHPESLAQLGLWQRESLAAQGADPLMGRKLAGLFHAAGLGQVETGVLGGQWRAAPSSSEIASEWEILQADLAETVSAAELDKLEKTDREARAHGERVLFVPTFYAIGSV